VDHNILKCVNLKGKASLNLIEANFLNKYKKKLKTWRRKWGGKKKKFDPNFFSDKMNILGSIQTIVLKEKP
jgi:hypothetical protein